MNHNRWIVVLVVCWQFTCFSSLVHSQDAKAQRLKARYQKAIQSVEQVEYSQRHISLDVMSTAELMNASDESLLQSARSKTSILNQWVFEKIHSKDFRCDQEMVGGHPLGSYIRTYDGKEELAYYPSSNQSVHQKISFPLSTFVGFCMTKCSETDDLLAPWLEQRKCIAVSETAFRLEKIFETHDLEIELSPEHGWMPKRVSYFCNCCDLPSSIPSMSIRVLEYGEFDGLSLPISILRSITGNGTETLVVGVLIDPATVLVNKPPTRDLVFVPPSDAKDWNAFEQKATQFGNLVPRREKQTLPNSPQKTSLSLPGTIGSWAPVSLGVALLLGILLYFKKQTLCLIPLLVLSSATGCSDRPSACLSRTAISQELEIDTEIPIIIETKGSQKPHATVVKITNLSNQLLNQITPQSTCGCTSIQIDKKALAPRETATLLIELANFNSTSPKEVFVGAAYRVGSSDKQALFSIKVQRDANWEIEGTTGGAVKASGVLGDTAFGSFRIIQRGTGATSIPQLNFVSNTTTDMYPPVITNVRSIGETGTDYLVSFSWPIRKVGLFYINDWQLQNENEQPSTLPITLCQHGLAPGGWEKSVYDVAGSSTDAKLGILKGWELIETRSTHAGIQIRQTNWDVSPDLHHCSFTFLKDESVQKQETAQVIATLKKADLKTECTATLLFDE